MRACASRRHLSRHRSRRCEGEMTAGDPRTTMDGQWVDQLSAVLEDPNLHTDQKMRLHREISELLRRTHEDLYGPSGPAVHERTFEMHGDHLPAVLAAVLVDPNLHTDQRLRLYHQLARLL